MCHRFNTVICSPVSLRNNMFELANRLVGIYKTTDISRSITVDPDLFAVPVSNMLTEVSMSQPLRPRKPPTAISMSSNSVPASQPVRSSVNPSRPSGQPSTVHQSGLGRGHPVTKHASGPSQTSVTDENNGSVSQANGSPARKRVRTVWFEIGVSLV